MMLCMYIDVYMCVGVFVWVFILTYTAVGWLRSVGSIRLYVSFAEYRLFYRALLQKRPIILSILLTEATPCLYASGPRGVLKYTHVSGY